MSARNIRENLLVAAAYFASGEIGLLLAIPPSNAVAVWPAAGLAFVCALVIGKRALPGILLGSMIIQTASFFDSSASGSVAPSLGIGLILSLGATIQAFAGAAIAKKVIQKDRALLRESSILLFCLIAGPLSCLLSASIAITTLYYSGVIRAPELALAWTRWWIGDSVGVLAFSPILLCFIGKPRALWRKRIISVGIPLFVLITVSFLAFIYSNTQQMLVMHEEFEKNANQFNAEIVEVIDSHTESTLELGEFFNNSKNINKDIFASYTHPKLSRNPSIRTLAWVPAIRHKDRQTFEQESGGSILINDVDGNRIPAPVKDIYYPIHFAEPLVKNESAYNFDLSSRPVMYQAMQKACISGLMTVTDPVHFMENGNKVTGVYFYAPVYDEKMPSQSASKCDYLTGFAASVYRAKASIDGIHQRLQALNLDSVISDQAGPVYHDVDQSGNRHAQGIFSSLENTVRIPVADRVWEVQLTPTPAFFSDDDPWILWLIIVTEMFIASIAAVGLLLLTGRAMMTERKVKQRTSELGREIKERKKSASLLALEKNYLEMIAGDQPSQVIFDSITRGTHEIAPQLMPAILLVKPDSHSFTHVSSAGLPEGFVQEIDGFPDLFNNTHCDFESFYDEHYMTADIAEDPMWADYSEITARYGIKACWAAPITIEDKKVVGVFALYFNKITEYDPRVADLGSRMSKVLAITFMRKQSKEQLTYHASHDALTSLVNRREFERRTERLLEDNSDVREHALCFMDLDQFKVVNDSCGHSAGDELLRQLTTVLKTVVRKRDTLARLGGDEFAVLMEHCSLEQARRLTDAIQTAISDYIFSWDKRNFKVGISIGLVEINKETSNLNELMKDADAACYMAKELGRNRTHVYHPEDQDLVKRSGEMQWISRINHALEEDRYCIYAQTIEAVGDDNGGHYELLIRMVDENGEIVPPGAFLPAAERYNVIYKLDEWMIDKSFSLLTQNPVFLEHTDFCSINLSGQSLSSTDMLNYIVTKMDELNVPAEKICFEITETAAISHLSTAIKFISTLKGLGCRFSLDDFGSGLSSFAYLKNLPVDFLKIDGIFVKDIADDPIDRAMVKSINDVGHVMGMHTIAEFVENEQIRSCLEVIGVDYVQGYGIGKPRPLEELLDKKVLMDDERLIA